MNLKDIANLLAISLEALAMYQAARARHLQEHPRDVAHLPTDAEVIGMFKLSGEALKTEALAARARVQAL